MVEEYKNYRIYKWISPITRKVCLVAIPIDPPHFITSSREIDLLKELIDEVELQQEKGE